MTTPRVRVGNTARQPNGVPLDWELVAEWDTPERYRLELYAGATRGRVLAIRGPYGPETAAEITGARRAPRIEWVGTFAARPTSWQNAQAALVRAHLAEDAS